jgi:hypothetical protein
MPETLTMPETVTTLPDCCQRTLHTLRFTAWPGQPCEWAEMPDGLRLDCVRCGRVWVRVAGQWREKI